MYWKSETGIFREDKQLSAFHEEGFQLPSNIRRTKSQNLNVSHLVLELSSRNLSKPGVKSRMKMLLAEQRRQAML